MTRRYADDPTDPRCLTTRALECAIEACRTSHHLSDRNFARACAYELKLRRHNMQRAKKRPLVTTEAA